MTPFNPLVFIVVGAALVLLSALSMARTYFIVRRGVVVRGTVIAHEESGDGSTPVVHFTAQGVEYDLRPTVQIAGEDWSIGRSIELIHSPGDPSNARIHTRGQMWFLPVFILCAGLLSLVSGAVWVALAS